MASQTRGDAIVDIFRLENRKIVEQRDVMQSVPETAPTTTLCSDQGESACPRPTKTSPSSSTKRPCSKAGSNMRSGFTPDTLPRFHFEWSEQWQSEFPTLNGAAT